MVGISKSFPQSPSILPQGKAYEGLYQDQSLTPKITKNSWQDILAKGLWDIPVQGKPHPLQGA